MAKPKLDDSVVKIGPQHIYWQGEYVGLSDILLCTYEASYISTEHDFFNTKPIKRTLDKEKLTINLRFKYYNNNRASLNKFYSEVYKNKLSTAKFSTHPIRLALNEKSEDIIIYRTQITKIKRKKDEYIEVDFTGLMEIQPYDLSLLR